MKTFFHEFIAFTYKQAYACIFGGYLLVMILITKYWYPFDELLYRYDFLFFSALAFQIFLIVTRRESYREVFVICIFHGLAMIMEVFKTSSSIASWSYPEPFLIGIFSVPLFAGFMFSAVGSYIARVWRIFDFRFEHFPNKTSLVVLASAIYINFFTHHFIWDFRYLLLFSVCVIFWKTRIYYTPTKKPYSMHLILGFFLVALFIWIGENIATYSKVWLYPSQQGVWHMVGYEKITSWFLLMIVSFVLVSLIQTIQPRKQ